MQKQIGIFGVNEEVLRLAQLLRNNSGIRVVRFWAADRDAAIAHAYTVGAEIAAYLKPLLTDDLNAFLSPGDLDAVIDSGIHPSFQHVFPDAANGELQILKPLAARLIWAYGSVGQNRKAELLQALGEIVESVDLTIDSDEVFARMLDNAVGATGGEGGSLMLLDPEAQELRIKIAHGVEPELWKKIRVPIGDGIAGRVAADARSLLLRGKADAKTFNLVRERLDVESAICVPLVVRGQVLGVLNLHHTSKTEAFNEDDLDFLERLATLDAQIIARSQEHEALRNQAARYKAVRQAQELLALPSPILERLTELCHEIAKRAGNGIATVYLQDDGDDRLSLAATSLEGGGFAGEYRIVPGQGIDGRVAQTGRPVFLREENGAIAYVCIPLHAGERLMGILSVQAGENPPRGRAAEEILLEMAAAMAEGIARVNRQDRIAVQATQSSALNEAGMRMISAYDVNEVARLATSSAAMILEAEHVVLRLQDEQTLRYVIRSYFGPADGRQQERLFRLDKDVSVESIRRRTPVILRDLDQHKRLADHAGVVRSLLSAPLKRDGRVIGTLTVYDKVAPDRFYSVDFNEDDFQVFGRLVGYVERAVENALFHAFMQQHRNFDQQTGLPNGTYLAKRIHEEIARSSGRQFSLAVATCEIENLDDILRASNGAQVHRVIMRVADALREHLRDFDILARTSETRFTILLPDPGHATDQRVAELARRVADSISKDTSIGNDTRVALAFGHAVYPGDGPDRETLIERAEAARIRTM